MAKAKTSTWKLYSHDLWGNEKDGYEINDYYFQSDVELPGDKIDWPDEDDIIEVLKSDGWIKKGIHKKSIEVEMHEDDIYITDLRTHRPEYTLRRK